VTVLESFFYGLVSGITEFLPVSSKAHQALLRFIFGVDEKLPIQELFIHIGVLIAVLVAARESIVRLFREHQSVSLKRRKRAKTARHTAYYDLRLIKTACLPLLVVSMIYVVTRRIESDLVTLMILVLLNGAFLLIAEHSRHGNRDARTMSGFDGIVLGVLGGASSLPGLSGTAMISTYATIRGAEGKNIAEWAILLSIPALVFSACFDIFCVTAATVVSMNSTAFLGYFVSACTAFCGGYIGISVLRLVLANSGFSKFSYYCFGIAILIFLLYLFT